MTSASEKDYIESGEQIEKEPKTENSDDDEEEEKGG